MFLSPSVVWKVSFPLMMPSRHLRLGSKTPDPESPVVATSRIRVENLVRNVKGSTCGGTIWDSVACVASTTMTGSPGHGGASHSCIRGRLTLVSNFSSSTNNRLKSTSSDEPCFRIFAGNAGNTNPPIRTPILASTAVRCAAVMINPEFRYTPEPVCSPLRIIAAVAIQGPPPCRSAPLDMIGAKSAPARQRANAKRTLSSPCRRQDHLGHLTAPPAQGNAEEGAALA